MPAPPELPLLRDLVETRLGSYLASLEAMVGIDCGSWSAAGVNRIADRCEEQLRAAGASVERTPHRPAAGEAQLGDLVVGRIAGGRPVTAGGRRLLLLAHMDTVFDDGAAAERPFRIDGSRAYGPGVTDDKAGLLAGLTAAQVLVAAGFEQFAELTLVCSPDEEIGSPFSRDHLERLARSCDIALGLECARANGDIVSARKGVAALELAVTGRAAHAGIEPERGVHAALEAAHKTVALQALNGRWPGVTCNVGVLRAGSRANIVPESAHLEVDLRAARTGDFDQALAAVEAIAARSWVDGAGTTLRRAGGHPPMERGPATAELVRLVQQVAGELGFQVADAATGGAGDANIAAATGTPTLDGLGPVGGDDHAPTEWLDVGSIVPRVTMLAGAIARIAAG